MDGLTDFGPTSAARRQALTPVAFHRSGQRSHGERRASPHGRLLKEASGPMLVSYLFPLVAVVLGVLWFGEQLTRKGLCPARGPLLRPSS